MLTSFEVFELFYGLFCEVPEMDIAAVWAAIVLNFFIEKHGKAVVDGHFGMIVF